MDRFHSKAELILAVSVVLCSGLNVVVAYSRWVELLFAVFFLEGILEVLVNIGKFKVNQMNIQQMFVTYNKSINY